MNSETLQRTGRPARLLAALLMVFITLGPASPGRSAAPPAAGGRPLDLAAMTLRPADLADAGQAGYVFSSAGTVGHVGAGSLAYQLGKWTDQMTDDDIRAGLEGAGLGRGYRFGLRLRQDPEDPRSDLARDVYGAVHEFADEDGATNAFDLLNGLIAESQIVERVEGDESVGDGSIIVRVIAEGEVDTPDLTIAFRAGRLIATVQVMEFVGKEPAVAEVEAIGSRLLTRIKAGVEGDTPGLGSRVPRLTSDEYHDLYEVRRDQYLRLDGEDFPFDLEEADALAARAENAGDATDVYALNQFIQNVETDPPVPEQFNWGSRLYRFADDNMAADWLAAQPDRMADDPANNDVEVRDIEPLADMPTFGDESIAVTYLQDHSEGYTDRVYRVLVRVSAIVANVQIVANADDSPIAAFQALVADQIVCLGAGGCPEPVTISDALAGRMTVGDGRSDEGSAGNGGPLDLAAMTLMPADLDGEGLNGYGLGFGQTTFPADVIASTAAARDLDEDEVADILGEAGFMRRYDSHLYLPEDEDDPTGSASRIVASYILEFADEDGAAAGFEFLENESESETAEDVEDAAEFGDQSEVTQDQGEDSASGAQYAQLDLTFQLGNLHAGVAIVDWTGEEPNLADVEALGELLLDRIETVLDDGAPGLGVQVLRLTGDDIAPAADYYLIRDGAANALSGESARDVRNRENAALDIDQTDTYRIWQQLFAGTDDPADDVWYLGELIRFSDDDAAAKWLADTEQRVEIDDDAPTFGDASIVYTAETADGTSRYRSVALRVGATVAIIDIGAPEMPSVETVAVLAEAQAACLAAGGCPEPLPMPDELNAFVAGLGEAGRQRDATPEPGGDEAGADGTAYTSPTYGYTLTYDPDVWTVADEYVGSYDSLTLQSESATIILSGTNVYDDLAGCLAGAIAGFQVGEGTPAEGIEGPTPAAGAEAALMAYDLPQEDGTVAKLAAYFECRWVVEGESTLTITLLAAAEVFPAVLPLYEDLIAGLTVPGAENGEEATGGETYVSPTWGYTVTWDPEDWVPTGKERDDGIEYHIMGSVLVMAVIGATEDFAGDPEACLTGMVEAAQGDTLLVPADDLPAPTTAPDAVGGVYALGDFAVLYFECRPLVPGKAVLQIRFGAPAEEYEAALPALEALLAGVNLPADNRTAGRRSGWTPFAA